MSNGSESIVLGAGNFSTTFLTEEDGKKVVVKKLKPKHLDNPKVIRLFENECLFNFGINGLPSEVEYFIDKGNHFIAKAYIEGTQLEVLSKKNKSMNFKLVLLNLCDLMIHLEEKNVTHCDLKPSNVLINERNETYLIDFGLAQVNGDPKINFTLFSLGFAAPELILNYRNVIDQRTDIFSFGMLMYFIIIGALPFTDSNPSIFTNLQILHPITKNSKISKGLMAVIMKCCAKYHFELPPNRYPENVVETKLKEGMQDRYQDFKSLKIELEKLNEKEYRLKRFRF